ncbi:helitron_like_N domain-containing protein [Trichonephila clavipes]|nr:helitron_like_N domain-containing protein [Trichonephila clavipes]
MVLCGGNPSGLILVFSSRENLQKGPSTRNVPYVPPIDIADLSTQNEPDILELHSDSDDNIDDISVQVSQNNTQNMDSQHSLPAPTYSSRPQHSKAHLKFQKDFLKMILVIRVTFVTDCVYNGFKYPPFPQHLKNFPLDLVTERLISPEFPSCKFEGFDMFLVNLESMDNQQKKNKSVVATFKDSPLYTSYGITVDDSFFNGQDDIQDEIIYDEDDDNDISEQIPIDESLVAQQQTLMWNDEMYLTIAPGGRIEFQHRGSPHAHILAWLDNAPEDALGKDYNKAVDLIDSLISVSAAEASDFQFITEEYSCAAYVVEYINKINRGVSNLQRKIIEVMDEHPEFDIFEITRNISINLLNHTEITSQEAAWYLLREPMSKSSTIIVYIPTVWPIERQRIKKTMKALSELDDDCTDIWKENWFDKYEKRPQELENVSLAQFVSKYYKNNKEEYVIRNEPKVIRYRNYDMATDLNEYKRNDLILQKRKEFESNIDIEKTLQICRELCREEDADDGEDIRDVAGRLPDQNPFRELYNNPTAEINGDLLYAMLNKLGPIAKKKKKKI